MSDPIARWDAFLAKIEERYDQVMTEAYEGCLGLVEECDDDPGPMTIAWMAMNARAIDLEMKVSHTWSDKVSDLFYSAGIDGDPHFARGQALARKMERQREQTRVKLYADVARRIWGRAREHEVSEISCDQCAAPMPVPRTFQSINVACQHCGATNTFEPSPRVRAVTVHCVHPLCEEQCWDLWVAMKQAEDALNDARGEPPHLKKAWEEAQIAYWRAYLEAQARMLPHKAATLDKDLDGKMAAFYLYNR